MELYVIRHTTPDVAKGICYGQSDISVTHTFPEESHRVLMQLPLQLDIVYTSPLIRCLQLADTIAKARQLEMVTDARLKELNFGDWELKAWNDLDQSSLMDWMNNYVEVCCPNGESYAQLAGRVEEFLNSLAVLTYRSVAIVTHGGVIKALHAVINQVSLKEAMHVQVACGAMVKFQV